MYNAADYAAVFLEAAVGKVSIKVVGGQEPATLISKAPVFTKRSHQPELTFSMAYA